jgi:hypothetical protein
LLDPLVVRLGINQQLIQIFQMAYGFEAVVRVWRIARHGLLRFKVL